MDETDTGKQEVKAWRAVWDEFCEEHEESLDDFSISEMTTTLGEIGETVSVWLVRGNTRVNIRLGAPDSVGDSAFVVYFFSELRIGWPPPSVSLRTWRNPDSFRRLLIAALSVLNVNEQDMLEKLIQQTECVAADYYLGAVKKVDVCRYSLNEFVKSVRGNNNAVARMQASVLRDKLKELT